MKRKNLLNIDWWLLLPVSILLLISLITLLSIDTVYFRNQLIALFISSIAFLVFSAVDYREFQLFKKPFYIASIIVLAIVLAVGIESRGAVRWVEIFGFRMQFSEFFKPFLMMSLAAFLAVYEYATFKSFLFTFIYLLPVALLIHLQPDLGTALIYVGVTVMTLIIAGYPLLWFGLGLLPILLASPFIWNGLHEYQRKRVLTFINPMSDPQGSSYNLIQAIIAVGSGRVFGKGLSEGTQSRLQFLPENHTDFIFATLSERLGFIGATIVLLAFLFLLYKIYQIFLHTEDRFGKFFAASAFFLILIQAFVNIGMNLGIVPVVGVTLPFVSFGGSSLLSTFIILGILSSISKSVRKQNVLEIR